METNPSSLKDLLLMTMKNSQGTVEGSEDKDKTEIKDQINVPSEVRDNNTVHTNVEPCSSKKVIRTEEADERDQSHGTVEGSNDWSAPEVLSLIFSHLDFHSLKKTRLVCKRWLGIAQFHIERRGIALLCGDREHADGPTRINKFVHAYQRKLTDLPQPLKSIDVDFENLHEEFPPILKQISSICPPLVLTRFTPGRIALSLAFPLIIRCSSTLVYLQILSGSCEADFLPQMEPKEIFPKLRHLDAKVSPVDDDRIKNNFTSIVAWIMKWNPIEKFESMCALSKSVNSDDQRNILELGSQLLLNVDIKNVKALVLIYHTLNDEALKHFISIPFTKLEHLKVRIYPGSPGSIVFQSRAVVIWTVDRCANTLKILDMTGFDRRHQEHVFEDLPDCPNVQELHMHSFHFWCNYYSILFPSLQVLNIWMREEDDERYGYIGIMEPFWTLKTLRIRNFSLMPIRYFEIPLVLLTTFPSVERLYIQSPALMAICECREDPEFSELVERVKHLEIDGEGDGWCEATRGAGYSFIRVLKGIETITLHGTNETVTTIPVTQLPRLKAIYFPWGECLNMEELLKMARGVEKVGITNCCIIRRGCPGTESRWSRYLLTKFFDSAPNAQCGCKYWKEISLPSWWR